MFSSSPAAHSATSGAPAAHSSHRTVWIALLAAAALYFLFFFRLDGVGMLGPDEPRYASIGREMALSGDWITPRLWGEPWFEKPVLIYWMTAAGNRAGLNPDLAPRLPVALMSAGFLVFFFSIIRREFGRSAALFGSGILATSAGWLGFSHVAATDLPLSATFSAAMLLCLPWIRGAGPRLLPCAAALFGAAVLAKGLVPLVLALPLVWFGRRRWKDWLRPGPIAAFLIVAAPWYVLCAIQNGSAFLADFFWKHHFERFASGALKHEQPFWFYVPVLLGGLFPWTPALVVAFRKRLYADRGMQFLLVWAIFGFAFFSAATNKLPGYLLPLFPAIAAILGVALAEARQHKYVFAAAAMLLCALPLIGEILPAALVSGITHVEFHGISWVPLLPGVGLALLIAFTTLRREVAFASVLAWAVAGVIWLEVRDFPVLDRTVSARGVWTEAAARADETCVGNVGRDLRYGLNYYSVAPLPDCGASPRPWRIEQTGRGRAEVKRADSETRPQ